MEEVDQDTHLVLMDHVVVRATLMELAVHAKVLVDYQLATKKQVECINIFTIRRLHVTDLFFILHVKRYMLPAFFGWLPGHVDPANSGHFWFGLVLSIDLFVVHLIHYELHHCRHH